jgi:mitogen-activated protein kinase kinase
VDTSEHLQLRSPARPQLRIFVDHDFSLPRTRPSPSPAKYPFLNHESERKEEKNSSVLPTQATNISMSSPAEYRVKSKFDNDINALDDEGWARVANSEGIEEMFKLYEGVSGSVTKCRLRKSGQIFAIKTITTKSSSPEHLLHELKINQSLHSPSIVRFFGTFVFRGTTTIAMEFCEGKSLEKVNAMIQLRKWRMSEWVIGKIAVGVLRGLMYLHEKRIIHRGVKPGNILLTRGGEVKLCDFGISKEVVESLCGTGEQTFVGTSFYMAPERIQGHSYSIRSDSWSLGISLMEVAQGRFPFPPPGHPPLSKTDLVQYLLHVDIASLLKDDPEHNLHWSKAFRHFLAKCLEKEAEMRPSPEQMMEHPWVANMQKKKVDMEKWIGEVWGWKN